MDKSAKIIVALVILAVSGFFLFSKISGWHKSKVDKAVKEEQQTWQGKTEKLKQEVTELKQELTEVKGQNVPEEKLAKAFGVPAYELIMPPGLERLDRAPIEPDKGVEETPPRYLC